MRDRPGEPFRQFSILSKIVQMIVPLQEHEWHYYDIRLAWRKGSSDDNQLEYANPFRTVTLVPNWKIPVCCCLGSRLLSPWPKHGTSPLLSRRLYQPARRPQTIAGAEESLGRGSEWCQVTDSLA